MKGGAKFKDLNLDKRADFLWNFSLSIFSKTKGIPWKFQCALKNVAAFVSLSTVASHEEGVTSRNGVASFEIANAWGEFAGRFFAKNVEMERDEGVTKISVDSLKVLLESTLDHIVTPLVDPDKSKEEEYLIFHLSDRYAGNVHSTMEEVIKKKGFRNYKILHIQEEGALRLYDSTKSAARRWPLEGSYWFLEKNIAFLIHLEDGSSLTGSLT